MYTTARVGPSKLSWPLHLWKVPEPGAQKEAARASMVSNIVVPYSEDHGSVIRQPWFHIPNVMVPFCEYSYSNRNIRYDSK